MSGSVNRVILVGRLTRDPEIRSMRNGGKIANLSVATNESWKDRSSGERKERAEFHRVSIFNERLADVAEKYLRKGSNVYLEGQLQTRKWTDQNGQERYTTEIVLSQFRGDLVLIDKKKNIGSANEIAPNDAAQQGPLGDDLSDEIPF